MRHRGCCVRPVDDDALTLTFNESLDGDSVPPASRVCGNGGGIRPHGRCGGGGGQRGDADAVVCGDGGRSGDGGLHRAHG